MSEQPSHQSMTNPVYSFVSKDFLDKSEKIENLGQGTFGTVALYDTPDGRYVIKESKIIDKSVGYPSDFINEVDILIKFRSIKTIVTLHKICFNDTQKKGYVVLEPLDNNLSQWAQKTPFEVRISQLYNIIETLGSTIAIMHRFSFVHNDIKTNNILVKSEGSSFIFKLADFGSTRYITDTSTPYSGVPEYRPPYPRDIYTTEFWCFMVSLIEVIIGGDRMICRKPVNDFYQSYINISPVGKIKFDLPKYFQSILTPSQFKLIPTFFWTFVDSLINGNKTSIEECLSKIGINLNMNLIDDVKKNIAKTIPVHHKFSIVETEFRNRMKITGLNRYFERFSSLFNRFLSIAPDLKDIDLKYYAEVALVIITKNHLDKLEYFKDLNSFLLFQRAFLMTIGYQVTVINNNNS